VMKNRKGIGGGWLILGRPPGALRNTDPSKSETETFPGWAVTNDPAPLILCREEPGEIVLYGFGLGPVPTVNGPISISSSVNGTRTRQTLTVTPSAGTVPGRYTLQWKAEKYQIGNIIEVQSCEYEPPPVSDVRGLFIGFAQDMGDGTITAKIRRVNRTSLVVENTYAFAQESGNNTSGMASIGTDLYMLSASSVGTKINALDRATEATAVATVAALPVSISTQLVAYGAELASVSIGTGGVYGLKRFNPDGTGAASIGTLSAGYFGPLYDGGNFYVTRSGGIVDDGETIRMTPGGAATAGTYGGRMMAEDGTHLFIADGAPHNLIRKVDKATLAQDSTLATGITPYGILLTGGSLYLAGGSGGGKVMKVNPATMAQTGSLNFDYPLSLGTDGTDLFVVHYVSAAWVLSRISLADFTVTETTAAITTDSPGQMTVIV
jgi:hypothetical protein